MLGFDMFLNYAKSSKLADHKVWFVHPDVRSNKNKKKKEFE